MAKNRDHEKYAYLDRLSTAQLKELLRADIHLQGGEEDVIFHILEVIEKREEKNPTGSLPDVDAAWEEFQQYYNIPEGEGLSLYPVRDEEDQAPAARRGRFSLRPMLRAAGMAAVVAAVIFGTLIGVQASGIDVFGAIGRWTEETFQFVLPSAVSAGSRADPAIAAKNSAVYQALRSALDECGIQEDLVPTWYPDGFEASEPEVLSNSLSDVISVDFHDKNKQFFSIFITRYQFAPDLASHTFEKDSTSVEQYTSGTRTFYILSNVDNVTATWSDGTLTENISGNLSSDEVKAIIDSIGGS